jgi:hypothetical protein
MGEYRGMNESRERGMARSHEEMRRPCLIEKSEEQKRWEALDFSQPGPLEDRKIIERRGSKTIIRIKK